MLQDGFNKGLGKTVPNQMSQLRLYFVSLD